MSCSSPSILIWYPIFFAFDFNVFAFDFTFMHSEILINVKSIERRFQYNDMLCDYLSH